MSDKKPEEEVSIMPFILMLGMAAVLSFGIGFHYGQRDGEYNQLTGKGEYKLSPTEPHLEAVK